MKVRRRDFRLPGRVTSSFEARIARAASFAMKTRGSAIENPIIQIEIVAQVRLARACLHFPCAYTGAMQAGTTSAPADMPIPERLNFFLVCAVFVSALVLLWLGSHVPGGWA